MRMITWRGETHSVSEWARIIKIPAEALRNRLNSGWELDRAMTQKVQRRRSRVQAPCGARTIKDCFNCQLADCVLPGCIKLKDE